MPDIAVVAGGSAGIGRAAVEAFARRGYSVAVLARGEQRLESTCAAVRAAGGRALAIPTDVADADQVEQAAALIERELGPISIWVNNASTTVFARVQDTTAEEYLRVTQVTYLGVVHGTLAALRRMQPRGSGVIIQTGSALAYRSIPLQSAYCGAKAAIRGFTDALRCELIHDRSNIRLTMVQLSAFNTPQFDWARSKLPRRVQPVPPIFQPELAGEAIVWAATHPRRELWVGRPAVKSILAARLLPGGFGDRKAARDAYDSQQTDEPARAERIDNLSAPAPGDFGMHGRFDASARAASFAWRISKHRWLTASVAALLLGALMLALAGIARAGDAVSSAHLRPRVQLIVPPFGFADVLRLRDAEHVHELSAQPARGDERGDRYDRDCPGQYVAPALTHAQPEVHGLYRDDRKIQHQVNDADALRTGVMQTQQIDQARDGGEQSTDDAAAQRKIRRHRPPGISGRQEHEIADQREDPQPDRDRHQHGVNRMTGHGDARTHRNLLAGTSRPCNVRENGKLRRPARRIYAV
jgi:NAD(P)-dependent dehydrogenase (short-subunit alcohol dehydrogenase family)